MFDGTCIFSLVRITTATESDDKMSLGVICTHNVSHSASLAEL